MGVYRKGRTYELYTSRKFAVPKIKALELGRPDVPLCAGQSPISMTLYNETLSRIVIDSQTRFFFFST